MKAEEDEDDEVTIGASRYPCLPSLVALQQMRNRLHMAHDGKRLMKWSAMATGRELRRLAEDIDGIYSQFFEDVKNCYMLLARCRYFIHNFNRLVLESVSHEACVTVDTTTKSVTGVRIMLFDVIESNADPFPCLGIEKGGETVAETKKAWLDLLKRLIHMLELRIDFTMIDAAHNNAQKKSNVLGKIIIPRTEATIKYILSELEELEREEFFRLKKVKEVKKKRGKKKGPDDVCPICKAREAQKPSPSMNCIVCKRPLHSDRKDKTPEEIKAEETKKVKIKQQLNAIFEIIEAYERKGQAASVAEFKKTAEQLREKLKAPSVSQLPIPQNVDTNMLCKACKRRVKPVAPVDSCSVCLAEKQKEPLCIGCNAPLKEGTSGQQKDAKRVEIREQLNAIIDIADKYNKKGIESASVAEFKNIAEQLQAKLKLTSDSAIISPNADPNLLCQTCKSLSKAQQRKPVEKLVVKVVDKKSDTKDGCPICLALKAEKQRTKPKNCIVCKASLQDRAPGQQSKADAKRVEIRDQLSAIIKITKEYEQKGVESASVAEFGLIAQQLQEKLKAAPHLPDIPDNVDPSFLCMTCKKRLEDKKPNAAAKKSSSRVVVKEDAESCNRHRGTKNIPCSMHEGGQNVCSRHAVPSETGLLHYIVDRLGDLILYSKQLLERGLATLNLTDFIRTCEDTKNRMQKFFDDEPGISDDDDSQDYEHLQCCVRHVISVVNDLKSSNAYTPSVEKLVETCQAVDTRLDEYKLKRRDEPIDTKKRLEALKDHIADVVQLTESYKGLGIDIPSVDKFVEDCETIQRKIDKHGEVAEHGPELDHLKGHVAELEGLTAEINKENLGSQSFEDFLKSCKEFKAKLDQYKSKKPPSEGTLLKMITQIDTAIGLSKEAKQEGLVSGSIDKFIQSCEDIKKHISTDKTKGKPSPPSPPGILKDLKSNISVIIDLITKFKKEGMVTPSVEKFLEYCKKAKAKIDEDAAAEPSNQTVCSEVCDCEPQQVCTTYQSAPYNSEPTPTSDGEAYPCGHRKEESVDELCNSCCGASNEAWDAVSSKGTAELGYFEKKVRKIVRVTRTQNPDGTVKEEKETIIITENMHDPDETNLDDDDDDEYLGDMSYESFIAESDQETCDGHSSGSKASAKGSKFSKCCKDDDSKVRVILFTGTDKNRRGFCKKSKSERSTRNPPLASPKIRQCLSLAETDARYSREEGYSQNASLSLSDSLAPSNNSQNEPKQQDSNDTQ